MVPSEVASITDPNAGVIGIRAIHIEGMHHNLLSVYQVCAGGESGEEHVMDRGILHLIVFLRLLVLLVPDIPAPESIIEFGRLNLRTVHGYRYREHGHV